MSQEYLQTNGKLVMTPDGKLVQVPDGDNLNDLADTNAVMATQLEEVAREIEDLIVKNGVIDGSPRGVYASLSALQTAYPSGANGVYVTTDNGHWNYYNNGWKDGGVYQSSEDINQLKEDLDEYVTEKNIYFDSFSFNNLYLAKYNFKKGYKYKVEIRFKTPFSTFTRKNINASLVNENYFNSHSDDDINQRIVGYENTSLEVLDKITLCVDCDTDSQGIVYWLDTNLIPHYIVITVDTDNVNSYVEYPINTCNNLKTIISSVFKGNTTYKIKITNNSALQGYPFEFTSIDQYAYTKTQRFVSAIISPKTESVFTFTPTEDIELIATNAYDDNINYKVYAVENDSYLGGKKVFANTKYDIKNLYTIRDLNMKKNSEYLIRIHVDESIKFANIILSSFNGSNDEYATKTVDDSFINISYKYIDDDYYYLYTPSEDVNNLIFYLNAGSSYANKPIMITVHERNKNDKGLYEYFVNPIVRRDTSDPTVWYGEDGYYYCFGSAWNDKTYSILRSTDLITWEDTSIYPFDSTIDELLEYYKTGLWASQVIKIGGWWLFYVPLVGTPTATKSAIAVFKSRNPWGKFTFVKILQNSEVTGINDTIDPCVVIGEDNKTYMFYGSTGKVHRIQLTDDGLDVAPNSTPVHVAGTTDVSNHRSKIFEGAYLYFRNGYWYLFVSSGEFNSSTYALRVGRSETITGDFVDKNGNLMKDGYAETIMSTTSERVFYGCGHNGEIFTMPNGKTFIFYHCHDSVSEYNVNGIKSRPLFIQEVKWDNDGFPYFENNKPAYIGEAPIL